MKRFTQLIGMFSVLTAFIAYGDGPQITVNSGKYRGDYTIDNNPYASGTNSTNTFPITATSGTTSLHYFWVGNSSFRFSVTVDGTNTTIDPKSIKPPECAWLHPGDKSTLWLNTVPITINPGFKYGGYINGKKVPGLYYMTDYNRVDYPGSSYHGKKEFYLIPGLVCEVDDGSYVGGSSMQFRVRSVKGEGVIPPDSISPVGAATAKGDTLLFNTAPINIETGAYDHPYIVSTLYPELSSSNSIVNCIRGLTAGIDSRTEVGGSEFYFKLGSDGKTITIVDVNPAATGGTNGVLSFEPLKVNVTPGTVPGTNQSYTGQYQLSYNYDAAPFQGEMSTYLLPSLVYWVSVGGSDSTITAFSISPPTSVTTCTPGGIPFTFTVAKHRK